MQELQKSYTDLLSRGIAGLTISIWGVTLAYFGTFMITIFTL